MRLCRCNAISCFAKIPPEHVFCEKHLPMVESDTRRVLGKTFRPGRIHQTYVFKETLERARSEILYFVTEGHRTPRDRPFEWDDEVTLL